MAYAHATQGLTAESVAELDRLLVGDTVEGGKAKARQQRKAQDQLLGFGKALGV